MKTDKYSLLLNDEKLSRYLGVTVDGHGTYLLLKEAIEVYEANLRKEAEEMMEKFDTDSFENDKIKIQKIKRATKKPTNGLKKGMVGVKEELVQDTKALNDYVKKNGKLPDGWVEVISEYTKFTIK